MNSKFIRNVLVAGSFLTCSLTSFTQNSNFNDNISNSFMSLIAAFESKPIYEKDFLELYSLIRPNLQESLDSISFEDIAKSESLVKETQKLNKLFKSKQIRLEKLIKADSIDPFSLETNILASDLAKKMMDYDNAYIQILKAVDNAYFESICSLSFAHLKKSMLYLDGFGRFDLALNEINLAKSYLRFDSSSIGENEKLITSIVDVTKAKILQIYAISELRNHNNSSAIGMSISQISRFYIDSEKLLKKYSDDKLQYMDYVLDVKKIKKENLKLGRELYH